MESRAFSLYLSTLEATLRIFIYYYYFFFNRTAVRYSGFKLKMRFVVMYFFFFNYYYWFTFMACFDVKKRVGGVIQLPYLKMDLQHWFIINSLERIN